MIRGNFTWPLLAAALLCLPVTRTFAADDASVVVAKNFMFSPATLTVKAGTVVTWTNKDEEPHTVINDMGLFHSGALDTNDTFSFKFDKPGTYHFVCSIHPRMVGTIVVE